MSDSQNTVSYPLVDENRTKVPTPTKGKLKLKQIKSFKAESTPTVSMPSLDESGEFKETSKFFQKKVKPPLNSLSKYTGLKVSRSHMSKQEQHRPIKSQANIVTNNTTNVDGLLDKRHNVLCSTNEIIADPGCGMINLNGLTEVSSDIVERSKVTLACSSSSNTYPVSPPLCTIDGKDQEGLTNPNTNQATLATSNVIEDQKTCMVCQCKVDVTKVTAHLRDCIKQFHRNTKILHHDNENSLNECSVCKKQLTHMTSIGRQSHINRCIDTNEKEKLESIEKENELKRFKSAVLDCPICGKTLKTERSRLVHLKKCSTMYNVSHSKLLELINAQTAERDLLVAAKVVPQKAKKAAKPKKPKPEKKMSEEDLDLAVALSTSLMEEQHRNDHNPSAHVVPTTSSKQIKQKTIEQITPPLLLISSTERHQIICDRAAKILSIPKFVPETMSHVLKRSIIQESSASTFRRPLWPLCDHNIPNLQRDENPYYVPELVPPIELTNPPVSVEWPNTHSPDYLPHLHVAGVQDCSQPISQTLQVLEQLAAESSYLPQPESSVSSQINCTGFFLENSSTVTSPKTNDRDCEHQVSQISLDVGATLNDPAFADVTVSVCDDPAPIYLHKVILAARSPRLKQVLLDGGEISAIFEQYDRCSVMDVLSFIYTGHFPQQTERISSGLSLSNMLKLNELSEFYESLTPDQVHVQQDVNDYTEDVLVRRNTRNSDDPRVEEDSGDTEEEGIDDNDVAEIYEFALTQKVFRENSTRLSPEAVNLTQELNEEKSTSGQEMCDYNNVRSNIKTDPIVMPFAEITKKTMDNASVQDGKKGMEIQGCSSDNVSAVKSSSISSTLDEMNMSILPDLISTIENPTDVSPSKRPTQITNMSPVISAQEVTDDYFFPHDVNMDNDTFNKNCNDRHKPYGMRSNQESCTVSDIVLQKSTQCINQRSENVLEESRDWSGNTPVIVDDNSNERNKLGSSDPSIIGDNHNSTQRITVNTPNHNTDDVKVSEETIKRRNDGKDCFNVEKEWIIPVEAILTQREKDSDMYYGKNNNSENLVTMVNDTGVRTDSMTGNAAIGKPTSITSEGDHSLEVSLTSPPNADDSWIISATPQKDSVLSKSTFTSGFLSSTTLSMSSDDNMNVTNRSPVLNKRSCLGVERGLLKLPDNTSYGDSASGMQENEQTSRMKHIEAELKYPCIGNEPKSINFDGKTVCAKNCTDTTSIDVKSPDFSVKSSIPELSSDLSAHYHSNRSPDVSTRANRVSPVRDGYDHFSSPMMCNKSMMFDISGNDTDISLSEPSKRNITGRETDRLTKIQSPELNDTRRPDTLGMHGTYTGGTNMCAVLNLSSSTNARETKRKTHDVDVCRKSKIMKLNYGHIGNSAGIDKESCKEDNINDYQVDIEDNDVFDTSPSPHEGNHHVYERQNSLDDSCFVVEDESEDKNDNNIFDLSTSDHAIGQITSCDGTPVYHMHTEDPGHNLDDSVWNGFDDDGCELLVSADSPGKVTANIPDGNLSSAENLAASTLGILTQNVREEEGSVANSSSDTSYSTYCRELNLANQPGEPDHPESKFTPDFKQSYVRNTTETEFEVSHTRVTNNKIERDRNQVYKTPQRGRTPKPKKKWTMPSPFTPMPNYESMTTPQLKNAVHQYGIKPLGKKRMVTTLKRIYQELHQYETDSECDLSVSGENAVPISSRDKPAELLDSRNTNANHSSFTQSDSTSSELDQALLEESYMPALSDEDIPSTAAHSTLNQQLMAFFTTDPSMYSRVLQFEPLELDILKHCIKSAGIKCSVAKLIAFMDEKCITFTMKNSDAGKASRRRKTKPRLHSQK